MTVEKRAVKKHHREIYKSTSKEKNGKHTKRNYKIETLKSFFKKKETNAARI